MQIKDNFKLILNGGDLKNILTHIVLCAECETEMGKNVSKMDLISLFNEELENQKWLNNLENYKHNCIEINIKS